MTQERLGRQVIFTLSVVLLTLLLQSSSFSAEEITAEDIKSLNVEYEKPPTKEELKESPNHIFITDKFGDEHFFEKSYWEKNKINIIAEMKIRGLIK